MSKSDAQYRRELELELERLTKELTDVRIQKSKQRLRIEQLQQEQNLLKDQLEDSSNSNDKELRTGLAHQLTTLTQVVKQKKVEHHMVKQEWEKSQEEYHQLKRTVGLLQGANVVIAHQNLVMQNEDDASLDEDLTSMPPAASTPVVFGKVICWSAPGILVQELTILPTLSLNTYSIIVLQFLLLGS